MDPYLDEEDPNKVRNWYQNTFMDHYNGNRQPFGLYNHPIHREWLIAQRKFHQKNTQILMIFLVQKKVATGYPGVEDPIAQRNMINEFLDYAQQQQNVWIVTNQQLLAWMRNPVPVSVSCTSFYSEVLVSLSHLRC